MNFITRYLAGKEGHPLKDWLFLIVVFGFSFLQSLGKIPLIEPDEGRYAEIPREMIESGDYITPFLNYVKYFEKPPLLYWLNALSFNVFGQNEFAARFPSAFAGFLTVLLTFYIGKRIFGRRAGLLAAIIIGTSIGYLVQARFNIIDMTLTLCMSATLGFFLLASREGEPRKNLFYYLVYIFSALTILAKGLIGLVLPGVVIFFYLLITKKWRLLREMRLFSGTCLFLLIASPWFILVSLKNPEFPRFFFIHEHFERFLTKVHRRYQPPWYFIPVIIGLMLPWSFHIPAAFKRVWTTRKRASGDERTFLALWIILIFGFFSASSSKLVPYILPVIPAIALLLGDLFSSLLDDEAPKSRLTAILSAIALLVLGIGVMIYPHVVAQPKIGLTGCIIIGLFFTAEGIGVLISGWNRDILRLLAFYALFSFILGVVGPPYVFERIANRKSSKELGTLAKANSGKDTILASYSLYDQGLSFYAERRVMVVSNVGELEFGSKQGDQRFWFPDHAAFHKVWDSGTPVLCLIRTERLDQLRSGVKTPIRILGQKEGKLLISNHIP